MNVATMSMSEMDAALVEKPKDFTVRSQRASARLTAGNRRGAYEDAQQALADAGGAPSIELLAIASRIALALGRIEECEKLVVDGLSRGPSADELHGILGGAMQQAKRWPEAVRAYERALNLNPFRRTYRIALGQTLEQMNDLGRAERVYRHGLHVDDQFGDAALNLANLLQRRERFQEALSWYQKAIALLGPQPHIYSNIGALHRKTRNYALAHRAYRISGTLKPGDSGMHYNLGNLLRAEDRIPEADAAYRRAIAGRPKNAEFHWNRALALLAGGDLAKGFREYEWRWEYENFPSRKRSFSQPMWEGGSFDGRVLLIHTEQGVGDVLQFIRFLPRIVALKGKTGRIVLECHDTLMTLLKGYPGVDQIIERFAPPPAFDMHLPLLSAPLVLGVSTLEDVQADVPYLPIPDGAPLAVDAADPRRLKVGFVFGGNPKFSNDRERSTSLDSWMRLFAVKGTQFFCLQKGDREPEVDKTPESVVRVNTLIHDFRDTALIMRQLDLVITTCTSVAHLAGALGVPFWVVLSRNPDWRWLIGREDSPWYPTARLFRQEKPGEWEAVFARVEAALHEFVAINAPST
ncbi:MAG: tetratricopeptide repeat protein [Alphaproteobacteria bacterium]|nr:tetratricopeptide repeat protein [Alphaproteobacteria bacterium]